MTIDQLGFDTKLARLLHAKGRLELAYLRRCLDEARAARKQTGATLARVLVHRGAITPQEVEACLRELSPDERLDMESSMIQSAEQPALTGNAEDTSAEPDDRWRLGARIDDYVLEKQLGAGGMGVVYLARSQTTSAPYAVKTLVDSADAEMVRRFKREGEAQAAVDAHPNVVRVHKVGHALGRHYMVMDVATGGDLLERLKTGPPDPYEAARIVRDLARGLAHLHAKGILHRDIKPANVLFDEDGNPKLVDFGVALLDGASRMTMTGETVGTPAYMAPEQALAHRDKLGPWTDVYALGGVLYFLLTGESPFTGTSQYEVMAKAIEQMPARPRSLRPSIPESLETLCMEALAKDLTKRPSALAMAAVLESIIEDRRAGKKETREANRRGGIVFLLVLVAGGAGAGTVAVLNRKPPPVTPPVAPPPPPPKTPPAPVAAIPSEKLPEKPPEKLLAWRLAEGTAFRYALTSSADWNVTGMMPMTVKMFRKITFAFRADRVEPEKVTVRGTVDALEFRYAVETETEIPEQFRAQLREALAPMNFDSARSQDKTSPLQRAVGRSFSFALDPRTGRPFDAQDVGAIQSAINEWVEDKRPMTLNRYRIAELAGDERFCDSLAPLLHLFPDKQKAMPGATWPLDRPPWVESNDRRQRMAELGVDVDVRASSLLPKDEVLLTWDGGTARGERKLEGKATYSLAKGRLVRSELTETYNVAQGSGRVVVELSEVER